MGEDNMQNNPNSANPPNESRFRSRSAQIAPSDDSSRQAVRQVRTEAVTRSNRDPRPAPEPSKTVPQKRRTAPDQELTPVRTSEHRQSQAKQDGAERQSRPQPVSTSDSSERNQVRQKQFVVVGRPKSEKPQNNKPKPVIVDSPNIDSKKTGDNKDIGTDSGESSRSSGKKFYFQRPGEISTLRKMLILVFGLLFGWCIAPAFFHIRGIGVISSSAVMLGICLTAMFWHLIDRNWTFKKAAVITLAALLFTACVTAFCVVTGIMFKASLTAVPSDYPNYTVVVLGCKAHGDQPSWMLNDRLEKAYCVLSDNPGVKCVVTGGMGDDEQFTEAYVMRKYLVEKGISPDRIYMEELAGSTEENLLYTKTLIKLNGLSENIVIVTDRFHELRARIWAEKSGFRNIFSACCETRPYLVTGYWFREMFGLARLYVFGV